MSVPKLFERDCVRSTSRSLRLNQPVLGFFIQGKLLRLVFDTAALGLR